MSVKAPSAIAGALGSSAFPLLAPDGTAAAPSYSFASATGQGIFRVSGALGFGTAGAAHIFFFYDSNGQVKTRSDGSYSWSSSANPTAAADTNLIRQAAGSVGLHNAAATSAQLSIFNTRTDASNYESLETFWSSNVAVIRTAAAGTGTARALQVRYANATTIAISIPTAVTGSIVLSNTGLSAAVSLGRVNIGDDNSHTATSGTHSELHLNGRASPTATSTMDWRGIAIQPTINYSNGTPGAGRVQLARFAPVNTALPSGISCAINFAATASALGGFHWNNQTDETTNYEHVYAKFDSNIWKIGSVTAGTGTLRGLQFGISGNSIGFYGATPVALQTGVAVSAAGIHAALVNLGLITA